MDWSRTKTIFIIVFSILNIFLYSLYLNRQMDVSDMQVLGRTSIEDTLRLEDIRYQPIPFIKKEVSYLSARSGVFTEEDLQQLKKSEQSYFVIDKTRLQSTMKKNISVKGSKNQFDFDSFLSNYVIEGSSYELWEVDEEEQRAVFFQRVKNETIFYNYNAALIVHWNDKGNVTQYEQRMLDEFVSFNHKKELLSPDDAVSSLVSRNYLASGSTVLHVKSGYSVLVQLTETQVFAPTWNVRVKLKDGTIENYFMNAIEGKVVEFQKDGLDEQTE